MSGSRCRVAVALLAGAAIGIAGCAPAAGGPPAPSRSGMPGMSGMDGMDGMDDMAGMGPASAPAQPAEAAPHGNGLAATVGGYTFVPVSEAGTFTFRITGPDGRTVTRYQPYESELLQFDLIRADLAGYQHLDPAMHADGTWAVALPALSPGAYRAYVTFAESGAVYRLSQPFTLPGTAGPAPAGGAEVDGFTVDLTGRAAVDSPSPMTIDIDRNGQPVGYFQRYLDGYAHLTAYHAGDLAQARFTPAGKVPGKPELTTQAVFPETGSWRVFVQFDTSGPAHVAAFTVTVA